MRLSPLIFAPLLVLGINAVRAASLPDTALTVCDPGNNLMAACSNANAGDAAPYPRQDARFGRDAQALKNALPKIGAGAAGFDYTKVANNGADVAAGTALGIGPTDWACTRDNITGLTWEVKTASSSSLRYSGSTYTWYSNNGTTNGGNAGALGTSTCNLPGPTGQCNTAAFVAAVNAAPGLCGSTDWRLPSRRELLTIVHYGNSAPFSTAIDTNYFPNTQGTLFFASSTYAPDPTQAGCVLFSDGSVSAVPKSSRYYLRLVRGGQF